MDKSTEQEVRYLRDYEAGDIVFEYNCPRTNLRGIAVRGDICFLAYVGAPEGHLLAGMEELRFACHYGVNIAGPGRPGTLLSEGFFWWGWDYGHATDDTLIYDLMRENAPPGVEMPHFHSEFLPRKRWTNKEIAEDVMLVLEELRVRIEQSKDIGRSAIGHVREARP